MGGKSGGQDQKMPRVPTRLEHRHEVMALPFVASSVPKYDFYCLEIYWSEGPRQAEKIFHPSGRETNVGRSHLR